MKNLRLTKGGARERYGLGLGLGLVFRVSNAVADPGIDGRGRERGSRGLAPRYI